MIKVKRHAPGCYEVTDGVKVVDVLKNDYWDGAAWVAGAQWDRYRVSDPVPTKREAVEIAKRMLEVDI